MRLTVLPLIGLWLVTPAIAAPRVAADIAPVHSLASMVMEGIGMPDLIIPARASPHGHALRPSAAAALSEADLVFWVGPELDPGFARRLAVLAEDTRSVVLTKVPGMVILSFAHDKRGRDEHTHQGRSEGQHGHAHDQLGSDPHIWLDPVNGQKALEAMAKALAELDPENADRYRRNATIASEALATLETDIASQLSPLSDRAYLTFHPAFGYFESRFGLRNVGSIAHSDAAQPGGGRLAALRKRMQQEDITCVFAEPQQPERLIVTVTEGTGIRHGTLDPLGADLIPGSSLYTDLLSNLANAFEDCLG